MNNHSSSLATLQVTQHLSLNQRSPGSRSTVDMAAKQIEGLFIEMMLKSMRATTGKSEFMGSKTVEMYTGLYDQHIAQRMTTEQSIGLSDLLAKQLHSEATNGGISGMGRGLQRADNATTNGNLLANGKRLTQTCMNTVLREQGRDEALAFINKINHAAHQAGQHSGVHYELILAQAALESGWGQKQILTLQGRPSYNLFGIKSTAHWQGDTTEIVTTEYINGQAQKSRATFKVYQSYRAAFDDYIKLLTVNPRYKKTIGASSAEKAAEEIQSAGYATDPYYAQKLKTIINKLKKYTHLDSAIK